jgi:hypothetical protein
VSSDWEDLIKPHPYDEGRFHAARLFGRPTSVLRHTLALATKNRERLTTRMFKPRERQFLEGFIDAIQEEVDRRRETGEEPADPTVNAATAAREEFEQRRKELKPDWLPTRPPLDLMSPDWLLQPDIDAKPVLDLPLPSGPFWAGADPLFVDESSVHYEIGTALALRALSGEVDLPLPPPVLNWTALDTLFASLAHDELARPKLWERERDRPPVSETLWAGPEFLFTGVPKETGMGRSLPPLPPGSAAPSSAWTGPEFLFSGVPKEHSKGSNHDPSRPLPSEFLSGPEFLFSGVPAAAASRRPSPPRDPAATPPPEPEEAGLDPGLLVAPEDPRLSLRARVALAWRALCDRLEYTPPHDWEP